MKECIIISIATAQAGTISEIVYNQKLKSLLKNESTIENKHIKVNRRTEEVLVPVPYTMHDALFE